MPAPAMYARESDGKDTLKNVNINRLRRVFSYRNKNFCIFVIQTTNFAYMLQHKYDIFISSRRKGGADKARILKTALEARGYKVFLDLDELKDGVFDKCIMDAIDSSPIFMFLLTPNSLERCLDDDDWVRKEIEYAVDNHKHFIPINPDCTFTTLPAGLSTKVMAGLGQRPFSNVMFGQTSKESINQFIIDIVRPVLAELGQSNVVSQTGATIHIETDLDCRIFRFGEEIGLAFRGGFTKIKLPKGKSKLKFIGLENEADSYECMLLVEDLEYEDYIEVNLLEKYNARVAKEDAEYKDRENAERKAEQFIHARIEPERRKKDADQQISERDAYLLSLPDDEFEPFYGGGRCGFKLRSTGEIVIPLRYDEAEELFCYAPSFNEGLARVRLREKWGFIDKTDKIVIPFRYDNASDFKEGLARINVNGKVGFIDKTEKIVIPMIYEGACEFCEGLSAVRIRKKWGFINKAGKTVLPFKYDDIECSFNDGVAFVWMDHKICLINKKGIELTPLKYDIVYEFREGLAFVCEGNPDSDSKCGFIDKTGKEIIPLMYNWAYSFREGKARVELNGEWFYIDKNGNRVE